MAGKAVGTTWSEARKATRSLGLRIALHDRHLHVRHMDVHRLLHAVRQSRCAEPLGAALALGLMRNNA